jgi:hypothetical protein
MKNISNYTAKNKAEQYERQKIKFLEDRITTLEKTLSSHAKILARFQMTEDLKEPNDIKGGW